MKKILITGASGLIGKGILDELAMYTKYDIYAVTTKREKLGMYKNINIIEMNLLSPQQCSKLIEQVRPQYMIHLAWALPGNDKFQNSQDNITWLEISLFLLKEFVKHEGQRFIFAGSSSEYNLSTTRLSEKAFCESMNLYGKCKKAFTEIALEFCSQKNTSFATARYFSVYGKNDIREGRAIPTAIRSFLNGQKIICKSPNSIWDYIYIEDAAKATIKIMESTYEGAVNVSTAIPTSMREVFETIVYILECPDLLRLENIHDPGQILVADNTILKRNIGYTPQTSLEEGIIRTINWWKTSAEIHNGHNAEDYK